MHKFQLHVCHAWVLLYQEIGSVLPFTLLQYQRLPTTYQILQIFIKYELKKDFPPLCDTQTLLPFYLFSVN